MDSKPNVVFEAFEVPTEWVHEVADDTLIAYLPGFRNEQLKVQLTTGGNLRLSGERPIGGNKFSRFYKEVHIPSNSDQNKIRANFNGGMLRVKFPKLIIQADEKQEQAKASAESDQKPAPEPATPAVVAQKQNNGVQEAPPMAAMEEQTGAMEADNVSDKTPDIDANESDKPMVEKKTSSSEKHENLGDSEEQDAAEKENIEPEKLDGTDKCQTGINMAGLKPKHVLDGLAEGLNNSRKMMNFVLAVLLVVVLAIYLRNAIMSLRNY